MSGFLLRYEEYDAPAETHCADEAEAMREANALAARGIVPSTISLYQRVPLRIVTSVSIVKRRKSAEKLSPPASETAPIPPSVKDGGGSEDQGALRAASPESGHDFGGTEGTSFAQRPLAPPPEKQQSVKKSKHPDPEKCAVDGCKFDVDKLGRCRDHGPGAVSRG